MNETIPTGALLEDGLLAWTVGEPHSAAFFIFDLAARDWIWRAKTKLPLPPTVARVQLQAISEAGVLVHADDRFYFVPFDGPTARYTLPDVAPTSIMLDGSSVYWVTFDDDRFLRHYQRLRYDGRQVEDLAPVALQTMYPFEIDDGRVLVAEFYDPNPAEARIVPANGILALAAAVCGALFLVRARKA